MWDEFGEFDSAEELNKEATRLLKEGDKTAVLRLAAENGIDKEDAEDFTQEFEEKLASSLMAAAGKLKVEAAELELGGILKDWMDLLLAEAGRDEKLCSGIRRKGKNLTGYIAELIRYSFENKVKVSDRIVKEIKLSNGQNMRSPLYMGIPAVADVKMIMREYYME